MITKKITIRTNTDLHEYVDFKVDEIAANVSAWQFKLKVIGRAGTELLSVTASADPELNSRVWLNAPQASVAELPTSGLKWYLLARDPENYVSLAAHGDVIVEGGAVWGS